MVLQTVASGVYRFDPQKQSFHIPEGHNNLNSMLAPFINQYTLAVDDLESAKKALGSLEKVTRRMHHVFCDKAEVPAWNFHLPIDIK